MKKMISILSIVLFVIATGSANPLNTLVSVEVSNKSIDVILDIISKETGYVFSYNPIQLNTTTIKSIKATDKSITDILTELFEGKVSSKLRGKFIILSLRPTKLIADIGKVESAKKIDFKNSTINNILKQRDSLVIPVKIANLSPCSSGNSNDTCHSIITNNNTEDMRTKLALLLLAFSANQALAQEISLPKDDKKAQKKQEVERFIKEELKYESAQVSFISPLGTAGTNVDRAYGFSLNILGGITGGTTGAEFAGLYNLNKYKTQGAQFAGIFNKTEGFANGAQYAGVANMARFGNTKAQISGVFNKAENAVVQISGVINKSEEKGMVQIAGVANIADSSTCQVGLVNMSKKAKVQVGLVNMRDTADGFMVGLVNIVKKGGLYELEVSGSEFIQTALTFRTGTEKLYAVLTFGANFKDQLMIYGAGLGTSWTLKSKWGINVEALSYQLTDNKFRTKGSHNNLAQLRPAVSYAFNNHLRVFAGPTLNVLIFDTKDNFLSYRTPGLIFSDYGDTKGVEGWIGVTAGLRYRF